MAGSVIRLDLIWDCFPRLDRTKCKYFHFVHSRLAKIISNQPGGIQLEGPYMNSGEYRDATSTCQMRLSSTLLL